MMIGDMKFPSPDCVQEGFWQPIFFRPNFDTPERLVAGIITCIDGKWELTKANALERLKCLYGDEAGVAIDTLNYGLDLLAEAIADGSDVSGKIEFSGIEVGDRVPAQAYDAGDLGIRRIRSVSSLHNRRREHHLTKIVEAAERADEIARDIVRDRLSVLVMEDMIDRVPQTRAMFNPHVLRLQHDQGARLLTHKAFVAFTGKRVAANFATLKPGRQKVSVDVSKRLMWDLEQHRELENSLLPRHSYEMILYHPAKDDPTISSRQFDNVMDVVGTLKDEGRTRDITVLPYASVSNISRHILSEEGFAAQA